jgi:DNA-binding protein HU-beta
MSNRTDLVDAIANQAGLSKRNAESALRVVLNEIADSLKNGERVAISGFGTFSVGNRAARTGRNPQTGESIQISAGKNVRFRAGKALKDAVN